LIAVANAWQVITRIVIDTDLNKNPVELPARRGRRLTDLLARHPCRQLDHITS
jgi:hypothetical protein